MDILKKCFIMVTILLAVLAISSCGVSKDEYDKIASELEKAKAELAEAKGRIAEMEKSINIPKIDESMMEKLREAQEKAGDLGEKMKSLTMENQTLNENMAKLKATIGDLQEKLKSFQDKASGLPLDLLQKR